MASIKKIIKKIIGKKPLLAYHLLLSKLASFIYQNPSDKLIVIGVTGTNGKTSTANFVSQFLECQGQKTGLASTVNFKVGASEWLNDKKMTMLGRLQTQRLLSEMLKVGCQYAIIETSSQGIEQFRHVGINYDLVIFSNLSPEHIEAHGGFDNYRRAKEKLFYHLSKSKHKNINGQKIKKIIVANADDQETARLKKIVVDRFVTYSIDSQADYQAKNISLKNGLTFSINDNIVKTNLFARFNVYNVLSAMVTVKELGFDLKSLSDCKLKGIAGRQEWIDEEQDFKVLVDYAPEPESLKQLYQGLEDFYFSRLIHILGSCGGGRDKARQPILGQMAGQKADIVLVTNEDPYDDDPKEIIDNVAKGAISAGKKEGIDLFKIADREKAISKALSLAKKDDLILITGKGAEQFICGANGQKIPWDDRQVFRKILKNK